MVRSLRTYRSLVATLGQRSYRRFCSQTCTTMEGTKKTWKSADAVCFDVDSTVIREEGIDELARYVGKGEQVSLLTKQAMRGNMKFQDALRIRLNVIRPSINVLESFVSTHPPELTPYIKELVSVLHKRGVAVYLISGGFSCVVDPLARMLDIPEENIYCNRLKFYFNGEYAGFDENEPTSRTGGKGEVIKSLKSQYGYRQLVMVGDGATDMEACPPADAFIGFGGNQVRDLVRKHAPWYVMSFKELVDELQQNATTTPEA